MRGRTLKGFGTRLTEIRQGRGLTQDGLARTAGVSRRVIAYYEKDDAQPPGALLVDLARALRVSTDELLGLKPLREATKPGTARLFNRLKKLERLSAADRRAVLKIVDSLLLRYETKRVSSAA